MKRIIGFGFFILGACLLISLCVWQVYRAQWKDGVLKELKTEYAKDPFNSKLQRSDFVMNETARGAIHSGYLQGEFISNTPLYWPKTKDGNLGFYIMYPFTSEAGYSVLVNLGWVYENAHTHMPLDKLSVPEGKVLKVGGIARVYDAGRWSLPNKPEKNRWYQYDAKQISSHLVSESKLLDAILFAKEIQPVGTIQLGDVFGAEIYPRDTHYQYALFWFTLLILWLVIIGKALTNKN